MKIHDLNFELYISQEQLRTATEQVAAQINADYVDRKTPPMILIVLGGAVIFGADLVRSLDFVTDLAFVKCSSYRDGMKSSCKIDFELEVTLPVEGRDVIVIEDIVDTGNTYCALHDYLLEMGATSVRIATMLIKREVYSKSLPIDYIAAESENIFVIGAGLDYNQQGRNLNGIYKLSK